MPPPDAPTPFSLADPDRVRGILGVGRASTTSTSPPSTSRSTSAADVDDAYAFVQTMGIVEGLTHGLDDTDRARALDALRETVAAHDTDDGVLLGTSAWLITARRP